MLIDFSEAEPAVCQIRDVPAEIHLSFPAFSWYTLQGPRPRMHHWPNVMVTFLFAHYIILIILLFISNAVLMTN